MKVKLTAFAILVIFMMSCGLFQAGRTATEEPDVDFLVETLESDSPASNMPTDTPSPTLPLKQARLIAISTETGCAVTDDGETRCWDNLYQPLVVESLPHLAGLECYGEHCIGFTKSGDLYEWYIGAGAPAQLLDGIQGVTDVAIGWEFACAVASGTAKCWGSVPGRNRAGTENTAIIDEPLFPNTDWTLVEAAGTYACFIHQQKGMCIGFFPQMGTNRYAYGFLAPNFGFVKDLRFSDTVYCVTRISGEVVCSDNEEIDPQYDPFPKDFFSDAVDFDVSDHIACKINSDKSVECIKDNVVTKIKNLKAEAVSIRTSGRKAIILLSDGSVAMLESHPEYEISYLAGFGSD